MQIAEKQTVESLGENIFRSYVDNVFADCTVWLVGYKMEHFDSTEYIILCV